MPPFQIEHVGLGRFTWKNASKIPLGSARDSLNFLHYDADSATARNFIDRVNATAPAALPVLMIHEHVTATAAIILLTKIGTVLYTWSLTPGTAMTSILTGLDATHLPGHCTANGMFFLTDFAVGNYISDGTSSHSHVLQKTGPQGTSTLNHRVGAAVGNTAAAISYYIADVEPTTGEETPSGAANSTFAAGAANRLADEGVAISGLTYTGHFTSKHIYRTKAGDTTVYSVTTLTGSTASYNDDSLDTALSTASSYHSSTGVITIEKPEAAKCCAFFKGRLVLGNLSGLPSRIRWSLPGEPTQFSTSTDARRDIGKNDGGEITGLRVFRGSLVIFKTNSIWVLNGDVDETNFVIFEAVPGRGCVAPNTICCDGDTRILFQSAHGLLSFDLATVPEVPHSDAIQDDFHDLEFLTYSDFFCAGIDTRNRTYEVALTPTDATTNSKIHAVMLDNGAWGRKQFAMGQIVPTCYSDTGQNGPVRNADGRIKLYVGDAAGYIYETDAATNGDGVTSGTTEATVTSATATTTTASAAAFRTTGEGLKGTSLTLYRAADLSYATVLITSNTATVITHPAFSGTAQAVGDTIYVGAMQATLHLNRMTLDSSHKKRWHRIEVEYEKAAAATPVLRVGYTLDGDTAPTATGTFAMNNSYFANKRIDRRAIGLSLYLDVLGVAFSFDLLALKVYADVLTVMRPVR